MEELILPLTEEEQAMLLLWSRIMPHIKDTLESQKKAQEAIRSVIPRLVEYIKEGK